MKTTQPYYHRNQQYSIIGLTNAAGTLVERYAYSAYGTLSIYAANGTVRTTSTYANRYTYTGREYDADLNLYHFRARWYDPSTGGFISRDPLGYVDGMSLYRGYFGARGMDPTGKQTRVGNDDFGADDVARAIERCQSVIARKNRRDKEPEPAPICDICDRDCQEEIAKAKADPRVKAVISKFSPPKCPEPEVLCKTCKIGLGGSYNNVDKKVRVCWTTYCTDETNDRLVAVLVHEFTHALQDCIQPLSQRDCMYDLQAEMEAYYCAKQCKDFDSCLHWGLGSDCMQMCDSRDIYELYARIKTWFNDRIAFGQLCEFPRPQYP